MYGSHNRKWILSVRRGVQQFSLSPCVRQVRFSGTTCSLIPQRIKMSPRSFCQLVPCGSFSFVLVHLLQFEEKPSAFVSVRCLWAEVCPGHVWLLCHTGVLSSKSSVYSGLSKQRPDLRRPTSRQRPVSLLKLLSTASDSLFYSWTLDSCQGRVWLLQKWKINKSFMFNWA